MGPQQKKNVNEVLRGTLTKEMMVEVEETFNMVADANGIMPVTKLNIALRGLGMHQHEAEGADIPSDGMDLDKFVEIVILCMKHPAWAVNEMLEAFAIFDKDASGLIDPNELRRVFGRIGEQLLETELEDALKEVDIDGDLKVTTFSLLPFLP